MNTYKLHIGSETVTLCKITGYNWTVLLEKGILKEMEIEGITADKLLQPKLIITRYAEGMSILSSSSISAKRLQSIFGGKIAGSAIIIRNKK